MNLRGIQTTPRRSVVLRLAKPLALLFMVAAIAIGGIVLYREFGIPATAPPPEEESAQIMELTMRAKNLFADGRYEDSISAIKEARRLDPANPAALDETEAAIQFNEAMARSEAHDYSRAIGLLKRAIQLQPDRPEYHRELGWNRHLAGRLSALTDPRKSEQYEKDSVEAFRRALELNDHDEWALHGLGRALGAMDRREEAADAYRRLIEIDPDSSNADRARNELREWGMLDD